MSGPRTITVGPADAGQKLTQFLARLVGKDVPKSALMRWIRTGQVRVDGCRSGPYDRVEEGQAVRVPPFFAADATWEAPAQGALASDAARAPQGFARPAPPSGNAFGFPSARTLPQGRKVLGETGVGSVDEDAHGVTSGVATHQATGSINQAFEPTEASLNRNTVVDRISDTFTDQFADTADVAADVNAWLPVLRETETLLVINKPAGLPVHTGSGWTDSVQTRLSARYAGTAFVPTLAHRLDRDTSGVLLAAKTYRTLAALHEAFRSRELVKIYLAWVYGEWTLSTVGQPVEMRDALAKSGLAGQQKVHTGEGKAARLEATALSIEKGRTLLAIQLFTGRTHQIRAQLSSRGHPIVGDGKYGGGRSTGQRMPMLLHAWKLSVDGQEFCAPPPWPEGWREAVPAEVAAG